MHKKKILITWHYLLPLNLKYKKLLKKNNISYDIKSINPSLNEHQLNKIIDKYDGIICGDDQINKRVIDTAKKLKVISKWGTGLNSINVDYAIKKGIKVYNSPRAFVESVTVYAFGILINLSRGLFKIHTSIMNNKWEKYSGIELKNKKIGVIGFGNIGANIASVASAFGLKILINDTNKKLKPIALKHGYSFVSKEKLLKNSDFIIIATDLNKSSFHLLSFKDFKIIKKDLILINISRGPVIHEEALIKNIKNKKIGGIGLDVFENEPLAKNHIFKKFHNAIFGSHNAFNTKEAVQRTNDDCIFNLIKGLTK
jgi:D-3-phosphoglycerate dehydrogenase / 2-oxoglutarate reductase|tara:strand:- start:658 stop:1596 length:939 start_codon:yes stop_codon:yes gene_type:complete